MVSSSSNITGKIVLFKNFRSVYEPVLRNFQKMGAAGVITVSLRNERPGQIMYVVDGSGSADIFIPVVQIGGYDFNTIIVPVVLTSNCSLNVTLTFDEINPYKQLNEGAFMIFWSVALGSSSFVCLVEALRRIALFISYKEFQKKIAFICLTFESIGHLLRIIFSVDPMWTHRIYPNNVSSVFLVISYPFSLFPTILISFYLHDLIISSNAKVSSFLDSLRIPFYATMVAVTLVSIGTMIPLGLNYSNSVVTTILSVVYTVVDVVFGVYYGLVSKNVLSSISQMQTTTKSAKALHRATTRIAVSLIGIAVQTVLIIIVATPLVFDPIPFKVVFLLIFLSLNLTSFAQIIAFEPTQSVPSSTNSTAQPQRDERETSVTTVDDSAHP